MEVSAAARAAGSVAAVSVAAGLAVAADSVAAVLVAAALDKQASVAAAVLGRAPEESVEWAVAVGARSGAAPEGAALAVVFLGGRAILKGLFV